jgi:hypothetical protein
MGGLGRFALALAVLEQCCVADGEASAIGAQGACTEEEAIGGGDALFEVGAIAL